MSALVPWSTIIFGVRMTAQIGDFLNAAVDDVMPSSMMTCSVLRTFRDWNKELPTWKKDEIVYDSGAGMVRMQNLQNWRDSRDWPKHSKKIYLDVINGLHIDDVRASQTMLEDLFMAFLTDYSTEERPIDLLVVLCGMDVTGLRRNEILYIVNESSSG